MADLSLVHFLSFAAVLFAMGLYGALTRRSAISILMSIELMLNATNVNLVAFSKYVTPTVTTLYGQFFAVFVITVAAAEAAVGLAIILAVYRLKSTVDADEVNLLKG